MNVNSISPSFQADLHTKVGRHIQRTITDPTDVNNPDAAVGGVVAAGGVGGAAVVAGRLKSMRTALNATQKFGSRVVNLKAKNVSILTGFFGKMSKFFKNSKATSWISKIMDSPVGKKTIGGVVGLGALGITAAQLFSAGDMAFEAYDNYIANK